MTTVSGDPDDRRRRLLGFTRFTETPADRDYQGGFATALMLKDLKLAMGAAHDANASVPMGAMADRRRRTR